jgi:hypothetical protein
MTVAELIADLKTRDQNAQVEFITKKKWGEIKTTSPLTELENHTETTWEKDTPISEQKFVLLNGKF